MIESQDIKVLIVDDEKYICDIIVEALSADNYTTTAISDPAEAIEYLQTNSVDLVLTDLMMGTYSGLQIMETAMTHHTDATVILMTAHPTVQTAISVLKKGAYDFLVKPFKLELLRATIRRGLEHQRIIRENIQLKGQVEFLKVVSATDAGVDIEDFLRLVARSCRKEMEAAAVAIIHIDPKTNKPIRDVCETDDPSHSQIVLNEDTISEFSESHQKEPIIHATEVNDGSENRTHIFISQPIYARHKLHGIVNVLITSRFNELTPGQIDALRLLAHAAAGTIINYKLYHDLQTSYLQAITGLANAIEARDECTAGHTNRVSDLAEIVARYMDWEGREIDGLIMGCALHDIGKIGVPDNILNKAGRLTDAERTRMEAHPEVGLMIIDGIDLFRPAIPYVIAHHERYDGTGYPNGLAGEDIPIEGRLLAVVDTFDAILSNRPYRAGAELKVAIRELIKYKGTQFDPQMVDSFINMIRAGKLDFKAMYNRDIDITEIDDILANFEMEQEQTKQVESISK